MQKGNHDMQTVSFIHSRLGAGEQFVCRETGVTYYMDAIPAVGYYVTNEDGSETAVRAEREEATDFIEAIARLDFICAQAACGEYAA